GRLGRIAAARRATDRARELEHEHAVRLELLGGLWPSGRGGASEGVDRTGLQLARRVPDAESHAVLRGELADELTLGASRAREVLRHRRGLLEAVEERPVARRNQEAGAGHAPPQLLPFLFREVRLPCH